MQDHLAVRKQLAAIASFRILFDKQKDVYEVLRCFIGNTLSKYSMRLFTVAELLTKLDEDFGFGKLPVFVVEKAVRPLTTSHTKRGYTCEKLPSIEPRLSEDLKRSDNNIQNVLDLLYQYVEKRRNYILTEPEKHKLENDFSNFLLTNRAEDDDAITISSFVVDNCNSTIVQKTLDEMREGVILYSGLSYSPMNDASKNWKNQLNVYLDTELLFHASGLNGELNKKVFDDFKALVDEVNADSQKKSGRKLIRFKCFDYVFKEVDSVFKNAQDIVEGNAKLAPGKSAQELLVKGVHDASEIVRKRVSFDEEMTKLGIENDEESEGYYQTSTYAFNIEDPRTIESLKKSYPNDYRMTEKRIMDSLQSLSYINVRRKKYAPKDFEQARYILLTENNTTKKVSRSPEIKESGVVPLCTDLYYFTNRLWIKLGKGFDNSTIPSIFTAASKARFVIASKLDMIVSEEYDKLCKEYEAGNITEYQATSYLHRLKTMAKNPEDIDSADIVGLNLSVNGSRMEMHLQEQAMKDAEYEKTVQRYEEQSKLMSKYEEEEAQTKFSKQLVAYKQNRNKEYRSSMCNCRNTVCAMILLFVIAVLLGVFLGLTTAGAWISILSSFASLLPGLIWFLLKKESVDNAFHYCFCYATRIGLKRIVIRKLSECNPRPSYQMILAGIKDRNGSC